MIPDVAVEAVAKRNFLAEQEGDWYFLPESVKYGWREEARAQVEAAAPHLASTAGDRARLIECLFRGYRTLGFDTDGDNSGAEMLSRMGIGGGNLDAFIHFMDRSFDEQRKDYDEATA